jgi:D-alanyl-D-alanine carboxypeptidase
MNAWEKAMKLRSCVGLVGTLAMIAAGTCTHAATTQRDVQMAVRIGKMATAAVAHKQVAGVAIGVARNGKVIYSHGFGSSSLELGTPITAGTIFRIGSLTKQFTAAAVVQLAERGLIRYEDPLSKFFPDFPDGSKVTVRELLNHTSGIHNFVENKGFGERETRFFHTTDQMVQFIESQVTLFDFTPGTAWSYSNSGYYLLGAIVEKVSGETLRHYLRAHIFTPVGMANTEVDDETEVVRNRAAGYDLDGSTPSGFRNASYVSLTVPGGAGSLRSTVGDLLRWDHALFGGQAVSAADVKEMITPGRVADGRTVGQARFLSQPGPPPPAEYGFGLMIGDDHGHHYIGHAGGIPGFSSELKTYPNEGVTIVVLSNTLPGADPIMEAMTSIVLDGKAAVSKPQPMPQ